MSRGIIMRQPLIGLGPKSMMSFEWLGSSSRIRRPNAILQQSRWEGVRTQSTEVGDDSSGHISAGPNEGILFFDNLYMPRINWVKEIKSSVQENVPELVKRFDTGALGRNAPERLVRRAIPESVPITVTSIVPRRKDGGAFVKFSHPDGLAPTEVETLIRDHLRAKPLRPWWSPFRRLRTTLVRGRPWLEDLYRFPSPRLKVEFVPLSSEGEAAELSQETLYSLFRRYGKLAEITPQPADSKITPRYAYLDFATQRNAIVAKSCMHGYKVFENAGGGKTGTEISLSYERKKTRWRFIWEWLLNHPRVAIPIIAVILGTITTAAFDPIRTFFIKAHVTHSFHLADSRVYKWFKSQANDILTFRYHAGEEAGLSAIFDDRKQDIEQIQAWLMETADTFIVVQGPRGSGKKELVLDQALKGRENTLYIDCRPIQEARGDSSKILAAAREVGYRPVFSWMNGLSSLVDLAAQGTIGVKSGFSETLDAQLAKIWQNTTIALRSLALAKRNKNDKDANLSDDDYLEAHPEVRPVVVVDNFLFKKEESSIVYDKLSEWAARLTTSNIAHVIFLTNDISYSKPLGKALPDRVFRQIALGDLSPEVAKKYVITHLDADQEEVRFGSDKQLSPSQRREDLLELDQCIGILGGRLTDLDFLARRLKAGQSPTKAVEEIIEQGASEIIKMFLLDAAGDAAAAPPPRKWSPQQAWHLISCLATAEAIGYNELLLAPTFAASLAGPASGGEAALDSLSQAELISIRTHHGRPHAVAPGKPLYHAVFRRLTADVGLKSRLDLALVAELAAIETRRIARCEAELKEIRAAHRGAPLPWEMAARAHFVLAQLEGSQAKIEAWEDQMAALKQVLAKEF